LIFARRQIKVSKNIPKKRRVNLSSKQLSPKNETPYKCIIASIVMKKEKEM